MITLLVRSGLVLLVLNQFLTPTEAFWHSKSSGSRVSNNRHSDTQTLGKPKTITGYSSGLPSQNTTRKGLGISAWGIVIMIVGFILAIVVVYYFSICYSICQPTKGKYDKMGIPTMA